GNGSGLAALPAYSVPVADSCSNIHPTGVCAAGGTRCDNRSSRRIYLLCAGYGYDIARHNENKWYCWLRQPYYIDLQLLLQLRNRRNRYCSLQYCTLISASSKWRTCFLMRCKELIALRSRICSSSVNNC